MLRVARPGSPVPGRLKRSMDGSAKYADENGLESIFKDLSAGLYPTNRGKNMRVLRVPSRIFYQFS